MLKKSVFSFVTSRHQADRIVQHLRAESFSKDDISVLFSDQGATRELTSKNITEAPAGAVGGAATRSFIGKSLGWIAGIGPVALPGRGLFIAAGPIVAALSGTVVSGIVGGLMGLGISEMDARRYERELDNENILLGVHTDDVGDIARVKDIFKQAAAQNICTSGEASAKTGTSSERGPHSAEMAVA